MPLVAKQVKRRRGTTAENNAFTGAEGEITVDTTTHELRVHDGTTAGGHTIPTKRSLATVARTGSYNDLTNKPTIPSAQVPSDWNATSGVARILNKPTIPTVGNGTITIKQGTTTKGTFTTNQSNNTTITLDEGGGGGSGSGHNIGDVFYTTRTDTALAGAVECNGGTYNTEDYEGEGSIGELLEAGKLDYISLTDYATAISTKGWCNKIGWDGTGTTSFRVPTITPRHYIVKVQEPTAENNYTWYRLYADGFVEQGGNKNNDVQYQNTITLPIAMADTRYSLNVHPMVSNPDASDTTSMNRNGGGNFNRMAKILSTTQFVYKFENTITQVGSCWTVSGQSAITPESANRVMFQLFNGTTDEAVATVGTVVAQVGELNTRTAGMIDYVVEKQDPTAENGYTWYRLYKSGWVEQGGQTSGETQGTAVTITLPITMKDGNYYVGITPNANQNGYVFRATNRTTTTFIINNDSFTSSKNPTSTKVWTVSGMAE